MSADPELPNGWIVTTLGTVIDYGRTDKAEPDEIPDDAWVLELEDIEKDSSKILHRATFSERKSKSTKNRFECGDVLYGKLRPYLNKVVVADAPGYCTTEIMPIKPNDLVESRYLFYWLKHPAFLRYVTGVSHGLNMPRLGTEAGKKAPFVLAPLAEQKRIADKLDRLLAAVDTCKARLDSIPAILKRFRQSVLAAATSGELTKAFRSAHREGLPHSVIDELLCNHKHAWVEKYGNSQPYLVPEVLAPGDFPRLPQGWSWLRLGMLGADPLAAVQTGPFGALLHSDEFVANGVPVIAVGNLTGMGFTRENLYFVDFEKAKQLEKFDVQAGDLLFARSGATLGKVCVAPEYVHNWRMTGHILRIRLRQSTVLPQYAAYCLWGNPTVLQQIFGTVRGMTRPGYNTKLLESIFIPLPGIAEQHEIVQRVEALLNYANSVESRVNSVPLELMVERVLAKAFRGGLTTSVFSARNCRD